MVESVAAFRECTPCEDTLDSGFLAIVDADRIHDYVFSPYKLKLIRGASIIQRELTEKELRNLLREITGGPLELISAGGGTVTALFGDFEDATSYCRRAAELFQQRTAIASATWVVEPWQGTFAKTLEHTQGQLERKKSARMARTHNSGTPYASICQDCGLYPAAASYQDSDQTERISCAGCLQRRKHSEAGLYLDQIAGGRLVANPSFEELAQQSRPTNYLAFVYIDFDRLGRYMHEHAGQTPQEYKDLSGRLDSIVRKSVFAACEALCPPSSNSAPFEILLMGGDDVVLMLAAHCVFRFLEEFDKKFSAESSQLPSGLHYSAAVVWAHQQFPIAQFRAYAEDLLRSAKQKAGNSVDYGVITESLVESPSESTARQPDAAPKRFSLLRTAKPYSLGEFVELESTIKEWRAQQIPANKVKALYRIAYEPFEQSVLDYYFLLSRLKPAHRQTLKKFFLAGHGIWGQGSIRTTRAVDLVELWDFVEDS
jgi:CRISPR RNA silencing complex Cmr2 subunit-like protein